jgi:hypothetical protein
MHSVLLCVLQLAAVRLSARTEVPHQLTFVKVGGHENVISSSAHPNSYIFKVADGADR